MQRSFFMLCLLLGLCAGTMHAQDAALSGIVTDSSGGAVPKASVQVQNQSTGIKLQTQTNSEGIYSFPFLKPGPYEITVQANGFKTLNQTGITLAVAQTARIDFSLQVGSVVETVTVEGDVPLINSESGAVSTVIDRRFVENIPLNGRSFQSLIALAPGVVLTKSTFSEAGQFSVNGQRANANYFSVDGVSANVGVSSAAALGQSAAGSLPGLSVAGGTNSLVSVDALQEFKMQTSSYAPEFGRSPGAQIQIVSRSGTNDFRGTLFDYFRNDALDATDWFANANRLRKPPLRQNDFGGVIGGPVLLPRFGESGRQPWYDGRNRTFFFLSYEGLRLRQPQTAIILVPSVAARQAAAPQIKPILDAYPIPNGPVFANGFAQFAASYAAPSTLNATSVRIDHTINEKLTLFGRYNNAPSETSQRVNSLSTIDNTQVRVQTLTLGVTQSISPKLSNDIRGNYSRTVGRNFRDLDNLGGAVPPSDSVLLPSFASLQDGLFTFQFLTGGGASLGAGKNVRNEQRQINVVDNLSIITGGHQLKFGIDYRWLSPTNDPRNYDLAVQFGDLMGTRTGLAQSVLVGARKRVTLTAINFSAYGQDTWKITPRVTLTYGVRWEVNPPPKGKNDTPIFTFQPFEGFPANLTLAPAGTPLYETTYTNLAPRVGVAYQLSQRSGREAVLREGFGIFYDLGSGALGTAVSSFPYTRQKQLTNVLYPLTPEQAAPPPLELNLTSTSVIYGSDPEFNLPRTYQWNVTLEQSLGLKQTFSTSYVAAAGRRLLRQEELRLQSSGIIRVLRNSATSDYHALQLQFRRRLSRGLQALASYTWSHSIDNASNDSGTLSPSGFIDPRTDRGSSDFDVRHSFSSAITYDIPAPPDGAIARTLLGGWAFDTLIVARSATPVNLIGRTNLIGFFSSFRPDLIPGVPAYIDDPTAPGGRRFNPAAFVPPPPGREGTLGRNVLRGFPVWQVDLALRRQFNLRERVKLQFRAELFNLFNHPNFGDPVGNLSSPQFGRSTQMLGRSLGSGGVNGGFNPLYQVGGPRSAQLAFKLLL